MSIDFSKDDGIDFSSDNIGAPTPAPQMIDYNQRAKEYKENLKRQDKTYDEWAEADRALDNPVSILMGAANLLDLTVEFLWYDGDGKKHYKGGEPPRVGLKICIAKCGECEVKSEPYMMKKDAKADACARLLQDVKQAYGDWTKIPTNKGQGSQSRARRLAKEERRQERKKSWYEQSRLERQRNHQQKWSSNVASSGNNDNQSSTSNSGGGKWITSNNNNTNYNRSTPYNRPTSNNSGPRPGALIGGPISGWKPPAKTSNPPVTTSNPPVNSAPKNTNWKSQPPKPAWKPPSSGLSTQPSSSSVRGWKPPEKR